MIERPMQVTQLVKEAFDNRFPSTSEAQQSRNLQQQKLFSCAAVQERQYWEVKQQCPPLQLPRTENVIPTRNPGVPSFGARPMFEKQETSAWQ